MAVKMDVFLLQYYMQWRFNHMPYRVRAQFDAYVKSDDFSGNMKKWKSELMHQNSAGKWVENELPDPKDSSDAFYMDDDGWEKFFLAFQNAFRNMAADRNNIESEDAKNFIDQYFGNLDSKPFSNSVANPRADDVIRKDLKNFLSKYRTRLEFKFQKEWGITDKDFTYDKLLYGISAKEYNTSLAFQKKIKEIAQYIDVYSNSPEFHNFLGIDPSEPIPDFSEIINGFDDSVIDPAKMELFRGRGSDKGCYEILLNTLVKNKKIYDVFKQYDNNKISGQIEKAKSNVDYDNKESKDFVPPKLQEELTPFEKLRGDISEALENYMGKYLTLSGDRLFFSDSAKHIVKAIDGINYKPTDGLAKILESKDTIRNKLKSKKAVEHFDWFVKTMEDLKGSMPKTFAAALNNGQKLRAIVEELIVKALDGDANKIEEAETAMEILSVVKYSYTNSKIMEAFNKSDFTIFSDPKLSINNGNQAMQFFTNAFDFTLKKGLQIVGYAATGAINAIKLSGSKFNHKSKRLRALQDKWSEENRKDKEAAILSRDTENIIDENTISKQKFILEALDYKGVNEGSLSTKKSQLSTLKADALAARDVYIKNRENFETADSIVKIRDQIKNLLNLRKKLTNDIVELDNNLKNPSSYSGLISEASSALAQDFLARKREKEAQKQQVYEKIQELYESLHDGYTRDQIKDARDTTKYDALRKLMKDTEKDYNDLQNSAEESEKQIRDYENATGALKEAEKRIEERNKKVSEWDEKHKSGYIRLISFWDKLETGRNLHLGRFYSWTPGNYKNKQANFDLIKKAELEKYASSYSF